VNYAYATDEEALAAFHKLASVEGIIPALETAHAIAEVIKVAPTMKPEELIVINLSGRGDKDVQQVAALEALSARG
jgi:tryptophan synthase beta chain